MTNNKIKITLTWRIIVPAIVMFSVVFLGLMELINESIPDSYLAGSKSYFSPVSYLFAGAVLISILISIYIFYLLGTRQNLIFLMRKKSRETANVLNSSFDLIGMTGLDFNWIEINSACRPVLGFSVNEVLKNSFLNFIYPGDIDRVKNLFKNFQTGEPGEFEARSQDKENNIRWITWNYVLRLSEGVIYFTGRDITEIKRANQIITLKNYQLDLAGIITDWENQRNEESLKGESVLIRSQVQSIAGYLEIVINDVKNLNSELKGFLNQSLKSVNNLLESVENIIELKYSKISDVSFKSMDFPINDVENLLIMKTRNVYEHRITCNFHPSQGIWITGDPAVLSDVIFKIILELDLLSGEKLYQLNSYVMEKTDETGIRIIMENTNFLPDFFKITGIDTEYKKGDFELSGSEWSIFMIKSLVNIMNGETIVYNKNNNLIVDIRLPIMKK
jgi:PAS domain S-box-containing protein